MPQQPQQTTATGLRFSWEENFAGRRRAFVRAGKEIPRSNPSRAGARHRSPRAHCLRADARRWVGTTPPARWCCRTSAPSIQVSCRRGIAEHSNYNFIFKFEIDKMLEFFTVRNRIGHHRPLTRAHYRAIADRFVSRIRKLRLAGLQKQIWDKTRMLHRSEINMHNRSRNLHPRNSYSHPRTHHRIKHSRLKTCASDLSLNPR